MQGTPYKVYDARYTSQVYIHARYTMPVKGLHARYTMQGLSTSEIPLPNILVTANIAPPLIWDQNAELNERFV